MVGSQTEEMGEVRMSVIATDGVTIAADTQMGFTVIAPVVCLKLWRREEWVLGAVGSGFDAVAARVYMQKMDMGGGGRLAPGPDPIPELDEDFIAIAARPGDCRLLDDSLRIITCGVPYAIGSGGHFAMGAMMAGKVPKEAVEIAIALDPYCGGDVTVLELT